MKEVKSLNKNKICFIACVNNDKIYKESLYYINNLNVPDGYKVEFAVIRNASSMTQGYNEAMAKSDAKYKVYMHQDVFIINKNFILDMMDIFRSDDRIGLLGLAGANKLSPNCIWWESKEKRGRVYDTHCGNMGIISFGEPNAQINDVKVVDGILMATQYDVHFRSDIFDGWHFYDISQSMEFIRQGYRVVVPTPEKPWCIHDCKITKIGIDYEHYRKIFINEYSKDLLYDK
jgi:hypothetical protein